MPGKVSYYIDQQTTRFKTEIWSYYILMKLDTLWGIGYLIGYLISYIGRI